MSIKHYALLITLFAMTLAGCSKSGDDVTPINNADLITRKWAFPEIDVKTDAKLYVVPTTKGGFISDDNVITISKGGTYSYLDNGKTVTGKWTLTDKTLVLTDADKTVSTWTVNNLTSTDLELGSMNVNITKGKDLTDGKVYTPEEQSVGITSLFLLSSLDKQNGGTIDFTKEPQPKSVQLILKGKGQ